MFTVGSHHLNFSLTYLCHNIFGKGCFTQLINLNNHYLILFQNNRDVIMQVQTLGRQTFGKKDEYFEDTYRKATSLLWGYLLINLHPKTTRDEYKLLTHIIPGELTIVYLPRHR